VTQHAYLECDRCHIGSGSLEAAQERGWVVGGVTVHQGSDLCSECVARIHTTAARADDTLYDLLKQALVDGADPDTVALICEHLGVTPWYGLREALGVKHEAERRQQRRRGKTPAALAAELAAVSEDPTTTEEGTQP